MRRSPQKSRLGSGPDSAHLLSPRPQAREESLITERSFSKNILQFSAPADTKKSSRFLFLFELLEQLKSRFIIQTGVWTRGGSGARGGALLRCSPALCALLCGGFSARFTAAAAGTAVGGLFLCAVSLLRMFRLRALRREGILQLFAALARNALLLRRPGHIFRGLFAALLSTALLRTADQLSLIHI